MIFLTFFLGLFANFIGYIPPGNINLTLVRITINRGFKQAMQFIIAFSAVEFFFTFFIMHAAKWLSEQVHLDVIIDWVMFALFLVLGIVTWLHRKKPPETKYSEHASIKYGIILGFVNPMQVPFWMICGTYLITHEWILDGNLALVIFSIGSAFGAFLCLFLYARFAQYIQSKFALSTKVINTAIAILFFSFAGYHLVKRIYLAVKPKEIKSVMQKKSNSTIDSLIGEWHNITPVYKTKSSVDGVIVETEKTVSCNMCPTITFKKDYTGFIKTPGKETLPFTWEINKGKVIFVNLTAKSIVNNGTYNLIFNRIGKEKHKEVQLIDSIKGIKYILD